MGRCFTITLLSMLVSVIANAQIQKNYLGLTLGTTTRNEVYQMYPNATRNWGWRYGYCKRPRLRT